MRGSSVGVVLRFTAPLLLVGVLYFVAMYGMRRPRMESIATPGPFLIAYATEELSSDPSSDHWRSVVPVTIRLFPQAVRAPFGTVEREVLLRGAYNDREIAFLLEFEDTTGGSGASHAPDGCAVMLTPGAPPATAQMMGHGGNANIWHWVSDTAAEASDASSLANQGVRALIATGPGTQAPMAVQTLEGRGEYARGRWSVVLKRQRESLQAGELEVAPAAALSVTVAVWDGARAESLSAKSISILRPLRLVRD
ncbi:MAG: hypothetical protein Q8N53_10815 [Longimicrobiales bacterium]|nr:hypothetical protein [Longimicrobiales bacterium]